MSLIIIIYRYKQYLTDIKILRVLITITKTAIMLVINNHNDDINNNIIIITIKKRKEKKKETKKAQKTFAHTHTLKTSREFSNFNVCFLDIHRNLFELCLL